MLSELRASAAEFYPFLQQFVEEEIEDPVLKERVLYAIACVGERERPFLLKVSTELNGGSFEDIIPLAFAAELFIADALTGDDLIDRASMRWGKEAVWVKWGSACGLLVPETLLVLANRALLRTFRTDSFSRSRILTTIDDYQAAFRDFFVWQHMESDLAGDNTVAIQTAIDLAYWRTGRLIQLCLTSPCVLYGADSGLLNSLSAYGRLVGTGLQLRDDLIDFIGEEDLTGKPSLGDVQNGQPNVVLAHFFQHAAANDRAVMRRWWNNRVQRPDATEVINTCIRAGSIEYALDLLQRHCASAIRALERLPRSCHRTVLVQFAEAMADLPIVG